MTTKIVFQPSSSLHLTGNGHPESPFRTLAIIAALQSTGHMNSEKTVWARPADDEEILLCHSQAYLGLVKEFIDEIAKGVLPNDGSLWLPTGDVNVCSDSLMAARDAVGAGLIGVDEVMQGKAKNIFAVIRPPGHHAETKRGMGFCLFNNAAIATRYAQKKYGVKRVAIVDWDVHHGNGTQEIFYSDPSVFYFSAHRGGNFYPLTGYAHETGVGEGVGTTLNCPIEIKYGINPRVEVLKAFQTKLMPALELFRPELIIISAGFDAHEKDPLGGFNLKDEDFATLTFLVKEMAGKYARGRIVSLLEGGYDLDALRTSVAAHVQALKT